MKLAVICLWITCVQCTGIQFVYQDAINDIYCGRNQEYFSANHDGNQVLYVDFQNKTVVITVPSAVDHISWDKLYGPIYSYAYNEMKEFQDDMEYIAGQLGYPPEAKEPPVSAMYVRDEVLLGSENTLICYVTGFYPPRLTVKWTRNNNSVTQGVSTSQIRINKDGTFNQFSTLKITPQEGDMYTCIVEHQALEGPMTRYWDVEVSEPSLGPSLLCGVGLTLGLLGVATGMFFFVKGKKSAERALQST